MASITYDGQSFMLDGRRIWIVSGSINYARIAREDWADRIHAAKLAGLNTIETSVVWARHEPQPGQFDFSGDNDLRHFVELLRDAGLYCILRPGPYVGQGFDMGGMPPWLSQVEGVQFRTTNQPFLEATSRYLTEVARQVRDLQVTSPGEGGPVLLVQSESGWTCGDDALGAAYLGEIDRFLRESGFTVPVINANDLWQSAEGEIDCWRGFDDLLAHLRQIGAVHPDRPRLLIEFALGEPDLWGRPQQRTHTPAMIMRRLTETIAAGAQFNIMPFCGGCYFGFAAGRTIDGAQGDGFHTTSADGGSPLDEAGAATPAYHAARRIATFASSFSRLLANVDPKRQGVALAPGSTSGGALSVVHAAGPQGSIAFLFGDETGKKRSQRCDLLLPEGTSLPVDLGSSPVGWCLFDTRLTVRAHMDFCNLSVFGFEEQILVCFGAAGATGLISINDSILEVEVPRGKTPVVALHEGITVIVVKDDVIDHTYFTRDGVYVGVAGVTPEGEPVFPPGAKQCTLVGPSATTKTIKPPANGAHKRGGRLNLTGWTRAEATSYIDGSSARFANINGPQDLLKLGAPYGYGWYRVTFPAAKPHRPHVLFPFAGDRLHLWHNGQSVGIVGAGPGAGSDVSIQLSKADHTLVALAEAFGRFGDGHDLGGDAGWFGHAYAATTFRMGKSRLEEGTLIEPLAFRTPLWHVHRGDVTTPERLTW